MSGSGWRTDRSRPPCGIHTESRVGWKRWGRPEVWGPIWKKQPSWPSLTGVGRGKAYRLRALGDRARAALAASWSLGHALPGLAVSGLSGAVAEHVQRQGAADAIPSLRGCRCLSYAGVGDLIENVPS